MAGTVRLRAHVSGLVQGVGFRPFVWREANALGVSGWVGNDAAGVVLEAEGPPAQVRALLDALRRPPALARVDAVQTRDLPPLGSTGFEVRASTSDGALLATVPPDTATCADCLRELRDPLDRRFGHPFVNCTSCGPRFTIVTAVPYDRTSTTMAAFPMCAACRQEYTDAGDRRFHAEPICCPSCGPSLRLVDGAGAEPPGDAIAGAAALLSQGAVLAVKGLGGYHLAVDARSEQAVAALRTRKRREERPFAVMVPDLAAAEALCHVTAEEAALLCSPARPIVLLRRRHPAADVAPTVAPGSPTLGLMLPYTALHALLLDVVGGPLVLTSGNASDEPIAYDDADAAARLAPIADAFLLHDRPIRTRVDDSVAKVVAGRPVPIRRSRGYVPDPLPLPVPAPRPVLACGAALKSTFCLARGSQAFLSHHIGDLDHYATRRAYTEGIAHLSRLLDLQPAVVAHDLHPDYASTRYALELPDVETLAVQHHHAHIASCLADNGETGPVIGVAFDGLGHGSDGTAWGGEFLVADHAGFVRGAHLAPVPMPGGDAAAREPWRMAAAHLEAAYAGQLPRGLEVASRNAARWDQVLAVSRADLSPRTSSAGRLFDGVAALLGVRDAVTYEGQAAIELEHLADAAEARAYPVPVSGGTPAVVDTGALVRALVGDLMCGTPPSVVAARFHNSLAVIVLEVCQRLREQHALSTVALSGGVFQNALLMTRCLEALEPAGFRVLTHRQVPCNDGGISLGQAAVAAAVLQRR